MNTLLNHTQHTLSTLRLTEIFFSVQGETTRAGLPTIFIRLTGCPLRCHYCDTSYAFTGGRKYTISDILEAIQAYPTHYVTVTGGEPLAQKNVHLLLSALCDQGYNVSLETSGALSIQEVDARVSCILDLKTPDSGEASKNDYSNLEILRPQDEIKFVICSEEDYIWAKTQVETYQLDTKVIAVLFSPSYQTLLPHDLATWILRDGLPVRLQLQLHKIIWGNKPGV